MDERITQHPLQEGIRTPDTFIFYGERKIPAVAGEPVAAALMAAGIRVMRHTAKTGEARGIFCGIGRCSSCMMTINGQPGVRSCVTPVEEGMQVEDQEGLGAWEDEDDA